MTSRDWVTWPTSHQSQQISTLFFSFLFFSFTPISLSYFSLSLSFLSYSYSSICTRKFFFFGRIIWLKVLSSGSGEEFSIFFSPYRLLAIYRFTSSSSHFFVPLYSWMAFKCFLKGKRKHIAPFKESSSFCSLILLFLLLLFFLHVENVKEKQRSKCVASMTPNLFSSSLYSFRTLTVAGNAIPCSRSAFQHVYQLEVRGRMEILHFNTNQTFIFHFIGMSYESISTRSWKWRSMFTYISIIEAKCFYWFFFFQNSAYLAWRHGRLVVNKSAAFNLFCFFLFVAPLLLFRHRYSLFCCDYECTKVFNEMTPLRNKLGTMFDEYHKTIWRLKDPSNLAVTRILFGEVWMSFYEYLWCCWPIEFLQGFSWQWISTLNGASLKWTTGLGTLSFATFLYLISSNLWLSNGCV